MNLDDKRYKPKLPIPEEKDFLMLTEGDSKFLCKIGNKNGENFFLIDLNTGNQVCEPFLSIKDLMSSVESKYQDVELIQSMLIKITIAEPVPSGWALSAEEWYKREEKNNGIGYTKV